MGFNRRHDIIELPAVPRESKQLRAIIGEARYLRRKSNLMRFAAYNLAGWAVAILIMHGCAAPAQPDAGEHGLFFPVVMTTGEGAGGE